MSDLGRIGWTFLWLSFISIGGGLGTMPEMERQAVSVHGWITAREFLDGYTLSRLTPGPGMLVAVFVGHRALGVAGGVIAGIAMFVPAALIAAAVARHWQTVRARPWGRTVERTLGPIGLGLTAAGVVTLARSALVDAWAAGIALSAALILLPGRVPPVAVMIAAGLAGALAFRYL